ncbi:hypothetical protein DPMN_126812 [Dreissena polymorpha]|uniref:Uncharacterized protein n=1 Tax=Dreissena polymorpha TaxID=45954 RepID=A0A9D4GY07_DREPO|nr:hypothetical protein DPMN_126812 [Dreissena polymorpha]
MGKYNENLPPQLQNQLGIAGEVAEFRHLKISGLGIAASKPFTPVKSFIFSPPISHTRSLRRAQPDIQQEAILLPGTVDQLAKEPIEEKKNTRRQNWFYTDNRLRWAGPDHWEAGRGKESRDSKGWHKTCCTWDREDAQGQTDELPDRAIVKEKMTCVSKNEEKILVTGLGGLASG